MIPCLVIHFFIFLFLINTIFANEKPKCEASDYCRVSRKVFPTYSNTTGCGVLPINYHIKLKIFGRMEHVVLHDQILQQQFDSKNCNATFPVPHSPYFNFKLITPRLTFFKCDKKIDNAIASGIMLYKDCDDEDVLYYSYPPEKLNLSQFLNSSISFCSIVSLPLIGNPSSACRECSKGGGRCPTDNISGQFECVINVLVGYGTNPVFHGYAAAPKSKRTKKIKIGVGAAAGASLLTILAVAAILLFRRWRRKNDLHKNSTLISRGISPDLSMQPDPEKGSSYFNTPIFTYKELEEATNNFDSSKELGDGGFGTVYYGKLKDGRAVAVKKLYENNCKRVEQFMNEVNILSLLRHQNLVSLYGCTSRHSRELLLVYEYVANGTVADHLHGEHSSAGMVTWPIRLSIAIESADALVYLHASDIIHRDVKTNNILLDKNFHVKVADFGLSRLFPNDVTHVSTAPQGTPGYVDPDYYQCYQLTDKSDVYSFGVVLCELISSKPAVDINRHRHEINLSTMALNKIHGDALHELVDMSLGFDTNANVRKTMTLVAELAYRCLQQDTDARPSMAEVLEVLKEIEVEGSKVVKPGEWTDDAKLLKNYPPVSPNSVTDKWASITSTPNTSS
ncbi:hypothetical protein MKX03_019445 [Papaver bracteatum]|nr:hypothetical protein MKX03_019445 [Papaver bracteatum]